MGPARDHCGALASGRGQARGDLDPLPADAVERFRPRGRPHHSLKHLFQENGVVPWMRGRVPLLYRADSLAAIGDLWISADVDAAPADEPRWRVQWTEHPAVHAPERR